MQIRPMGAEIFMRVDGRTVKQVWWTQSGFLQFYERA